MSGPKASSFQVDPAVLAEQRRRVAARDSYVTLVQRRNALAAKHAARRRRNLTQVNVDLGGELAAVDDATTETIETWNAQMVDKLQRAEAEIAAAEHAERTDEVNRRLASLADGGTEARLKARAAAERRERSRPAPKAAEPERTPPSRPHPSGPSSAKLLDEVTSAVARLRPGVGDAEREEVETLAERVLAEQSGRSRSLLVELQVRVQRSNASARARADAAAQARTLLDGLHGLSGTAIDRARRLLDSVIAGDAALLTADVERIGRIRAAAEADAARSYVASELAAAFRAASCPVQEGFATEVLAGRRAYTSLADEDDHAVEVQLRDEQVLVRVVRTQGSADASADTAAEREFCRRFGTVSADVHSRGVRLRLTRHTPPGQTPVPLAEAAADALETLAQAAEPKARRVER